jgi:hypothetical protein
MAGFKLSGEIRMEKDHPVYGDYFGGRINATFNALSDGLKVGVSAVFGYKDFRYWYVEGTAKFHPGITIGPVALNGFTGGAYYKMSATGKTGLEAYAPDKKSSLGVKAGVAFIIGNENAVHGNALFEMNFLSGGGIKNIRFYGTAALMAGSNSDDEDKIAAQYQAAQSSMTDMSQSVTDKLSPSLSGSDIAKSVFPGGIPDIGINAYITMNYDFPAKTFDANFKVMVNMAGGFLKGAGSNGEAGWATMHCSPGSWYFHVGTPANPIGVKLGLGSLSLTTTSYFMLGDKLEPALPPPDEVLSILKISSHQADYMKYPQDMKLGKGVAFGSRFKFDTGNLNFLIIYAHFAAGIGFDLMLSDMSHYACEGSNSPIGINGWYANGQTYAFLEGELGVKINLLFIKKNVPVIQGATAALLQAKGPNPTWIGGQMALKLNVLGGLIRADMKMKFSFGNDCKLVRLEHDSFPIDYPIIADVSPADYSDEIDVFTIPQVTFNMPEGSSIVSDNKKTYRIRLESFTLTDSKGAVIAGKMEWNMKRDALRFIATEILPSSDQMKIKITVNFEESTGNAWKQAMFNGKPAKEEKEITFKTGEAPNYIPKQNIEYLYPLMEQKNMFMSESNTGYIKLKRGQKYLFPAGFTYQTVFTPETGSAVNAAYSYKPADQIIEYTLPVLEKGKNYVLDFTVAGNAGKSGNAGIKTETREITDESGETFSVDIEQQMAGQAIKEDAVSILDYTFRTSQYHTLAEKLSSLSFTPAQIYINEDTRSLYLKTSGGHELFDAAELAGTEYTDNKPLIQMEATLTDDYYTIDIAPKLYNWHPLPDISITKRDVAEYGAPPAKAITLYNGYLNMVIANTYNAALSQTFPFIYNLPYYYSKDYVELFNKAVNYLYNDPSSSYKEQLMPLLTGHFLFIRQGEYPVKFAYRLPGNRQGATRDKTINYVNTLDWR